MPKYKLQLVTKGVELAGDNARELAEVAELVDNRGLPKVASAPPKRVVPAVTSVATKPGLARAVVRAPTRAKKVKQPVAKKVKQPVAKKVKQPVAKKVKRTGRWKSGAAFIRSRPLSETPKEVFEAAQKAGVKVTIGNIRVTRYTDKQKTKKSHHGKQQKAA
jgi:hypothetical protein